MRSSLFAFLIVLTASSQAYAADCKSVSDSAERLKCFDAEATKAEVPSDQTPLRVQMVDPDELFVGSKKYMNKDIGLKRVRCYYADVGDYRCITDVMLSVFTKTIEPKAAQEWFEKNCDTLKLTLRSPKCIANVTFRYSEEDVSEDVVSGYERRKVIRPPQGITVIFERDVIAREKRK